MRKKPTLEENRLFEGLTDGSAANLFLLAIELNGVETTAICAYEDIPGEEKIMFAPVAILVTEDIAKQIKLPEGIDELTLGDLDKEDPDDEEDFLSNLPQN
jgi:hypothetical protein